MNKEQKNNLVDSLAEQLSSNNVVYLADTSELTVDATTILRRECFKSNVSLTVVKNTLLKKAMDRLEDRDYSELEEALKGPTAIMFAEAGNAPARVIKNFRKKNAKPLLKGAWIDTAVYLGDDQLESLSNLKSREELIGDIIGLLQSPAKNVISALKSGGGTIAGIIKTLSEREG